VNVNAVRAQWLEYGALAASTVAALMLRGYGFGAGNHSFYLPLIDKIQNPALFPRDLVVNAHLDLTFFYHVMAGLLRLTGLSAETLFFVLFVVFTGVLTHAVYRLAVHLSHSRSAALLAVVLLLIPKSSFGGADVTGHSQWLYNAASLPLCLYALDFYLRRRHVAAFGILGMVFLFHALYAVYMGAVIGLMVAFKAVERIRTHDTRALLDPSLLPASIVFTVLAAPLLMYWWLSPADVNDTAVWLAVGHARSAFHLFPTLLQSDVWPLLLIALGGLSYAIIVATDTSGTTLTRLRHRTMVVMASLVSAYLLSQHRIPAAIPELRWLLYLIVIALAVTALVRPTGSDGTEDEIRRFFLAFVVLIVGADIFINVVPVRTVIELQLFRSTIFLQVVCVVYVAAAIDAVWRRSTWRYRGIAAIIGIVIFFNGEPWPPRAWPPIDPAFVEVQRWAEQNTDVASSFVVPPDTEGFRVFSKRGIYSDWKDGTIAVFSARFAREWMHRMDEFGAPRLEQTAVAKAYDALTEEDFIRIGRKYHQEFAVVHAGSVLRLRKEYGNDRYVVYRIASDERSDEQSSED